jgi:hypothetical protein
MTNSDRFLLFATNIAVNTLLLSHLLNWGDFS